MKQHSDPVGSDTPKQDKRNFRLILFRRTFGYFGTGLVISALLGGLYGDRLRFIWGLCAVGAVLIGMGWWEYLRITDSLPFRRRKSAKKPAVPYILRKEKEKKRHKPAFLQNAEDFEDDLTPYTTADPELLTDKKRSFVLILSRIAAGVLLFLISFLIPQ